MSQQQKVKSQLHHNFSIPWVHILPFIDGGGGRGAIYKITIFGPFQEKSGFLGGNLGFREKIV